MRPHTVLAWLERLSERANPMLVRCVRQDLRSRAFIGSFSVLLAVSLISACTVAAYSLNAVGTDAERSGRALFGVLACAWSCAVVVIQGTNTFRAVSQERNDDTWDLVDLTGMGPRRILRGLMLSNLVQGMLYTAPIAPFLVMAYMLRGLDLLTIVFALVIIPFFAVAASSLAVLTASLSQQKAGRATLGGLLGIVLLGAWLSTFSVWFAPGSGIDYFLGQLRRGDADTWLLTAFLLDLWVVAVVFMLVLSGALLSHPAANRSTGPRVMSAVVWVNALLWAVGWALWMGRSSATYATRDAAIVLGIFVMLAMWWVGAVALFAVTEDYELSPRQARAITDRRGWRRAVMQVFGPGANRGRLWFLVFAALTMAIGVVAMMLVEEHNFETMVLAAWFSLCYFAMLILVADALYRGPFSAVFDTPAMRRVCIVLSLLVWGLAPILVGLFMDTSNFGETVACLVSPFTGTAYLANDTAKHPTGVIAVSLLGIAAMVLIGYQGSRLAIVTRRVTAENAGREPRP
jgi:hypothetical protein